MISPPDSLDPPKRRPLKIFASDPMLGKTVGNRARVDIENETLTPGPCGERIRVIDYNASTGHQYEPVNLDHPSILMTSGLDPSESDPRFHQQMVYAVAMRTLENFDRALGRRNYLTRGGVPLRIFPHAFLGANAYYDPQINALLFGYFKANAEHPGNNLPGQMVYTCLSHDVIAHEMTHAIVNRLRRHYLEPSNPDVLAFHEAISDIVALFQHFSFPDIVRDHIGRNKVDFTKDDRLTKLAEQFGHAAGMGGPLRSAIGRRDMVLTPEVIEPHDRGSILVAAVFDGFSSVFVKCTRDLIRIATGGSGRLPDGDLHPDLVARLSQEASKIAQSTLTMCIRAFDYLPPVDVTFGDFLRAMVTADFELNPDDEIGLRASMIEAFRLRQIYPVGVTSLAEESLLWPLAPPGLPQIEWDAAEMLDTISEAARGVTVDARSQSMRGELQRGGGKLARQYDLKWIESSEEDDEDDPDTALAKRLHQYANANAEPLLLRAGSAIQVTGFHPVFRVGPNGRLLIELVVQYLQRDNARAEERGGLPARGGTTLIAGFDGRVRYVISKPLDGTAAAVRLDAQEEFVRRMDRQDPMVGYLTPKEFARRMKLRASLSALHLSR